MAFGNLRAKLARQTASKMHPLPKALMIFAIWSLRASSSRRSLFQLAIPVLICYGVYYVIWASLIRPSMSRQQRADAAQRPVVLPRKPSRQRAGRRPDGLMAAGRREQIDSAAASRARTRRQRPNWRDRANQELAAKPLREKLSELIGSMIMAAMFAAVAACIAPLMLGRQWRRPTALPLYMWLAIVGTLGSWAILVPAKFAEGKLEDQVPMRITLLAARCSCWAWWPGCWANAAADSHAQLVVNRSTSDAASYRRRCWVGNRARHLNPSRPCS